MRWPLSFHRDAFTYTVMANGDTRINLDEIERAHEESGYLIVPKNMKVERIKMTQPKVTIDVEVPQGWNLEAALNEAGVVAYKLNVQARFTLRDNRYRVWYDNKEQDYRAIRLEPRYKEIPRDHGRWGALVLEE